MNLYSINTIKQELLFSPLVYRIKKSDYSESLILTYNDIDNNPHQEALGTNRSILSNWLEILDYDTETKENLDKTFDLLLSSIGLFGIKPDMQKDKLINKIDNFIKDFDDKAFSDVASSVLDILKECFDPHPVLAYLYPYYYALLHSLYLYAEKSCSYEETVSQFSAKITVLLQELLHLKSSYEQAREYTQSVFIEPYTDNASVPSTTSAALYHSYCKILNKSNFNMDAFDFPINEDYLKNIFDNNTPTWSSYFELFSKKLLDTDTQDYHITSFAQFLHIGLSIMMSGEMVIRKCKLCNGYFQAKHSSDQMYCSRIYKNTSATCSEVGVRKTYKEKLFQHPIHQEFTKSYNKLYGRIRRGKVPNDTPLMEQLKKLHDEYTEKYENTHKKDREAVWKEYIQKNKELLG
ncbi:DUF6076 domain-containing protein [Bacteroides caecimuris]|uniref:DUF6076 domain-containing protein n=2 Tax=Bacteria TaxID=2 RepID=UPI0026605A35|nr:DUF6076 domain-containing protein [Bacteroides caecimuris]